MAIEILVDKITYTSVFVTNLFHPGKVIFVHRLEYCVVESTAPAGGIGASYSIVIVFGFACATVVWQIMSYVVMRLQNFGIFVEIALIVASEKRNRSL